MKLSAPPAQYSNVDQAQMRAEIEREDAKNYKRGRDIEVQAVQRLILADTVTGARYAVQMISGALTATLL